MTTTMYGIPNCDTVKKARKWLDGQEISYVFHDYKKEGADPEKLRGWIGAKGVERIVEVSLNKTEKKAFDHSVASVKDLISACKKLDPTLGKKAKPRKKAKKK